MRRSWASITVGALVLVVGVHQLLRSIRSTSERNTAQQGIAVWALFHDASGLFEKSRVQTAGISVGQIEKRELDPGHAKAKITIRMRPGITLYENAVVIEEVGVAAGRVLPGDRSGRPSSRRSTAARRRCAR